MRAVRFHRYGGPEVLRVDDVPVPEPSPDEVLVEVDAVGVTLPVVRLTRGNPDGGGVPLPSTPGGDVVGRVVALPSTRPTTPPPGAEGWSIGQRVAGLASAGAYAQFAALGTRTLAAVPDAIGDQAAAALVRSGQVALGALDAARPAEGEDVLVTAAAGAVGQLAVQLAAARGAGRIVAAVSSEAKAALLRRAIGTGSTEVTSYARLGEHRPVDVVLDGVGGDVQAAALDLLAPFGRLVTFNAVGATLDTNELRMHSRSVIGFNMAHFAGRRPETYLGNRQLLWDLTRSGTLCPVVHELRGLASAGRAHQLLESRRNIGKVVLVL